MTPMSSRTNYLSHRIEELRNDGWTPGQIDALLLRLKREATRVRIAAERPSAGKLAASIDPMTVQTPALDLIDDGIEWALSTPNARLAIAMSPQEGKSTRCAVWAPIRALQLNPERRIIVASYAESLASEHSRTARNLIETYGSRARDPLTGIPLPDKLGLELADDKSAASHWTIKGHRGGVFAAGVGGGMTGRPADLIVIDDPYKNMEEADSPAYRARVDEWFRAVVTTRLAPGAPIILIQTRWTEHDLAGSLLADEQARPEGEREWRFLNIPVLAEEGTPDALEREPGTYLQSARGRTPADWERIKRSVGPRVWSALYQGRPTPAGGGLFSQDAFDRYRVERAPQGTLRIVAVDPADTGKGDEAGIVAGTAAGDGTYYLTGDWSERMTAEQWAWRAVVAALETQAHEVAFEAYSAPTTYERMVKEAWEDVRRIATALKSAGGDIQAAARTLADGPRPPARPVEQVSEVAALRVPSSMPFRVVPWKGKGNAEVRAAGARQASSTGRLRTVDGLRLLEEAASTWQSGQHCPDRVAAAVVAYERMVSMLGEDSVVAVPREGLGQSRVGAAMRRSLSSGF